LTQISDDDEYLRRADHVLSGLIDDGGPIDPETDRRGSRTDAFEAIARAIVGQQLSTKAAATIWGRVIDVAGGTPPRPRGRRRCGRGGCSTPTPMSFAAPGSRARSSAT